VALTSVADIIIDTIRTVDTGFRYGGEEFALILPETDMAKALQAAERLRENIEKQSRQYLKNICDEGLTVSIGVATYPDNGLNRDDILGVADALMYRAKRDGKNRVYSSEGSSCSA